MDESLAIRRQIDMQISLLGESREDVTTRENEAYKGRYGSQSEKVFHPPHLDSLRSRSKGETALK